MSVFGNDYPYHYIIHTQVWGTIMQGPYNQNHYICHQCRQMKFMGQKFHTNWIWIDDKFEFALTYQYMYMQTVVVAFLTLKLVCRYRTDNVMFSNIKCNKRACLPHVPRRWPTSLSLVQMDTLRYIKYRTFVAKKVYHGGNVQTLSPCITQIPHTSSYNKL